MTSHMSMWFQFFSEFKRIAEQDARPKVVQFLTESGRALYTMASNLKRASPLLSSLLLDVPAKQTAEEKEGINSCFCFCLFCLHIIDIKLYVKSVYCLLKFICQTGLSCLTFEMNFVFFVNVHCVHCSANTYSELGCSSLNLSIVQMYFRAKLCFITELSRMINVTNFINKLCCFRGFWSWYCYVVNECHIF